MVIKIHVSRHLLQNLSLIALTLWQKKGVVNDPLIINKYVWIGKRQKRRDIWQFQASTYPNSQKKRLRAYLHTVFQKPKFLFLKNVLLIFSNFQKNVDISNLKKKKNNNYFHDIENFISFQEFDFLNLTLTQNDITFQTFTIT